MRCLWKKSYGSPYTRVRFRPRPGRIRPHTCKERTTVAFDAAHTINVDRFYFVLCDARLNRRPYIYDKRSIVTTKCRKSPGPGKRSQGLEEESADNYRQYEDDKSCRWSRSVEPHRLRDGLKGDIPRTKTSTRRLRNFDATNSTGESKLLTSSST